jgi:ribosome-associated protein
MIPELPNARLATAVEAALDKKAAAVTVLDLQGMGAFTDFFLVCHGWSAPQIHAIAEEIEKRMGEAGVRHARREGYGPAEGVLLDYGDFVVHVFNEKSRAYYDLERLWRAARRIDVPEPGAEHAANG